ncbi:hypothetical protein L7F22_008750 [Adiantum nelumboides]|nr:hypothetical protein [Adiantum nelumboides]
MFYSQYLLSKKGPLGFIWIAAHLERRLRKKQVTETDIGDSVDSILYSEVPIALRISSHLLLGVVKIYAKKVDYLFHDCSEALLQIAQSFQASAINLSPKAVVAPYRAITLPESFDFEDLGAYVDPEDAARAGTWAEFEHHVSDRDLITLQEPTEVRSIFDSLFTLDGGFSEGPNPYTIAGLPTEDQISRAVHAPSEDRTQEDIDFEDLDDGRERIYDLKKGHDLDRAFVELDEIKALEVEDVEVTRVSTTRGGQEVHVETEQTIVHKEVPATMDMVHVEAEQTIVHKEGPATMDMDIDHHVEKEAVTEEERHGIEEVVIAQAEKSPVGGGSPVKKAQELPLMMMFLVQFLV